MGSSVSRRLLATLGLAGLVGAPALADAAVAHAEFAHARSCTATESRCAAWERVDFHAQGLTLYGARISKSGAHFRAERLEFSPRWDRAEHVLHVRAFSEGSELQDALDVAPAQSTAPPSAPPLIDLKAQLLAYLPSTELVLESRGNVAVNSARLQRALARVESPLRGIAGHRDDGRDATAEDTRAGSDSTLRDDTLRVALSGVELRRDAAGEIHATTNLRVTRADATLVSIEGIAIKRSADGRRPDSIRASILELAGEPLRAPLDVSIEVQSGQIHGVLEQDQGRAEIWLSHDDARSQLHLESDHFELDPWLALARRVPALHASLAPIVSEIDANASAAITRCANREELAERCLGGLAVSGALDAELRGAWMTPPPGPVSDRVSAVLAMLGDATLTVQANDLSLRGLVLDHHRLSGEPVAFAPIHVSGQINARRDLTTASLQIGHHGVEVGLDLSVASHRPVDAADPSKSAEQPTSAELLASSRLAGQDGPTPQALARRSESADHRHQGVPPDAGAGGERDRRGPGLASLDVALHVPATSCQALLDATPAGLLGTIAPTQLSGEVGLRASMHIPLGAQGGRETDATERDDVGDLRSDAGSGARFELDFPFLERCVVTRHAPGIEIAALHGAFEQRFVSDNGRAVRRILDSSDPSFVALRKVPALAMAFVSLEDSQFRRHDGFDRDQIVRAFAHNLSVGRVERGASTISQQTARILWLGTDRSFGRKIQEAFLTAALERELSKDRILELYINLIELGPNVVGVREAARFYFDREPEQMSLLQAVHLASLPPAPVRYAARFEDGHIDAQWREHLKQQVRRMQFHHLVSREEAAEALNSPLNLVDRSSP